MPIHINGRTEHDTVALGNLVNVIHFTLLSSESAEEETFKVGAGECDITDVNRFLFSNGNGIAITACVVGIPCLMAVIQSSLVAVVIDVKVDTVLCKVPGILNLVERAIHDNLCTHWQEGIVCIYCNSVICLRVDTRGGGTTGPYSAADGAAAISAGDDLTDVITDLDGTGCDAGFCANILGKAVLQIEYGIQFRPHLIESEILILGTQVTNEHGGIMADLGQIVVVFLTAGMPGFYSVDLFLKLGFQFRVVGIRTGDLDIVSGPRGSCYGGENPTGNHRTGLERCNDQKESHCSNA